MNTTRRTLLAYWLPLITWMILIFMLSHQDKDESRKTSEWILAILNWLQIEPATLVRYHVPLLVRKLAHFTEYFILYLLTFRVMRLYLSFQQALLISWFICVAYAGTDEYHQTFIEGREGQLSDVGIDSSGALFAMLLTWLRHRKRGVKAASFPEKI